MKPTKNPWVSDTCDSPRLQIWAFWFHVVVLIGEKLVMKQNALCRIRPSRKREAIEGKYVVRTNESLKQDNEVSRCVGWVLGSLEKDRMLWLTGIQKGINTRYRKPRVKKRERWKVVNGNVEYEECENRSKLSLWHRAKQIWRLRLKTSWIVLPRKGVFHRCKSKCICVRTLQETIYRRLWLSATRYRSIGQQRHLVRSYTRSRRKRVIWKTELVRVRTSPRPASVR